MLKKGNSKLGPGVYTWSIPSGLKEICVGASELCLLLCYAMRGHFRHRNTKESHRKNYEKSLQKDFVATMVAAIRYLLASVVRIHVGGDFYSAEYVNKWISIAKRNSNVTFYAYTRSWRDPDILEALKEFSQLPNVYLWFSTDKETGAAPKVKGVRTCYLQLDYSDMPKWSIDLVFREDTRAVVKWIKNSLVCPAENGITNVSCTRCKLCFTNKKIPKRKKNASSSIRSSVSDIMQNV